MGENRVKPTFLDIINVEIPYNQIYMRLGFYKFKTEINGIQKDKIDKAINQSVLKCNLKASFIKLQIKGKNDNFIDVGNGLELRSKDISKFLKDSDYLFLLGVTAGKNIVEYRDNLMKNEDTFDGVVADAVGSEIVEFGVEWLHNLLRKSILKEGLEITKKRFSPGYGDLSLFNQKNICDILQFDKIGVNLNENFILIPEKSVTAIVGVY